jgi:chromate transporter
LSRADARVLSHTECMRRRRGIRESRLAELARLFLKLGTIGFGGPAVHIALMRQEVVERRGWLSEQHFLDLVGATNAIPGPNSTELAIHIGRERAGWKGLLVAGTAFIAPAALIVLVLAWLYVEYGATPAAENVLYGIAPVVIAIVADALWKLARVAAKGPVLSLLGVIVFGLYLWGVNEILLLASAAAVASVMANGRRIVGSGTPVIVTAAASFIQWSAQPQSSVDLSRLFLLFLKFGSVVFGSGYVLLAFIRADLVSRLGWLTNEQLVDAISIGQFTPGPVFTTATFIGYLVAGFAGALLATLAIFLPSFLFVAGLNPLIPKIRRSPWLGSALDGLNIASVGLMAGVTLQLGRAGIVDALTIALAVASFLVVARWKPNAAWLILAGAVVGLLHWLLV